MARHPWPGNVRELRNYVERCLALREMPVLEEVEEPADSEPSLKEARKKTKSQFERKFLEELLAKHNNNISAAARGAGIDRKYLYRLLWRHGLK
jgi:DNA-binding NtrC family response regulator